MTFLSRLLARLTGAAPDAPETPPPSADLPTRPAIPGRATLYTDAGTLAAWDREAFMDVTDFDTWEAALLETEDMERHIRAGCLVPVGIAADGVYEVQVRVGSTNAPAMLDDRELRYRILGSEPYLFRSRGRLYVSGIEYVGAELEEGTLEADVPPGDHAVTVHLLAWGDEPGMADEEGRPAPDALPDFVVLLNPALPGTPFRTSADTFDRAEEA